jgi:peptidoglycan hydrolase CwlO-like protein
MQGVGRYLAVVVLVAVVCLEGYYIMVLRDTIQKQNEDLRNISVQLQLLKSEQDSLNEEISSARNQAEERDDGDTVKR